MALLASLSSFQGGNRRARVGRGKDVVRVVAVGAGGDTREAETRDLAVIGVAVALQRLPVAGAALADDIQAPGLLRRFLDVVRRVAVGADRRPRISAEHGRAVDTLVVQVPHSFVT